MTPASAIPWLCPFTVAVDTREQLQYSFCGLKTDAAQGRRPLTVPLVARTLDAGDYSIDGHQHEIAVERKSLADAFGSFGRNRRRFKAEIERLAAMRYAAVVIEAEWSTILSDPPPFTRLSPKMLFRTVLHWQLQFPAIHWWMCAGRRHAEITTFRLLEAWWKRNVGFATMQTYKSKDGSGTSAPEPSGGR